MTTSPSAPKGISKLLVPVKYRAILSPLSWDAEGTWHSLRLYCAQVGNDGRLPKRHLHAGIDRKITKARAERAVEELVDAGLLIDRDDHWEFVGWLEENPSAEEWNDPTKLMVRLRRDRLMKDWNLRARIQARDENRCQYCNGRVRWTAKSARDGGTYDHVDPDDPENRYEGIVVACRKCNGKKGHRTPEQWVAAGGLPLLNDPARPFDEALFRQLLKERGHQS